MIEQNNKFYRAAILIVEAAALIKEFDFDFANSLLDKAQYCKEKINIDESLEKEITSYELLIEQRL